MIRRDENARIGAISVVLLVVIVAGAVKMLVG